jgi:peptide-methionine (R)-S-oxide reductase
MPPNPSDQHDTLPSAPEQLPSTPEQWKSRLTAEQYRVARQKGTEPAFTGQYYHTTKPGIYRCVCCGTPLFSSAQKYDSGSGWPSFSEPVADENVKTRTDESGGMQRTEVLCRHCEAHLGHVFDDGPQPTGLRYCINSVCLKLDESAAEESPQK